MKWKFLWLRQEKNNDKNIMMKFSKMHALGNDFMVIDGVTQSLEILEIPSSIIAKFADRHRGIGFDQCLLIQPALNDTMDFFYTIFNADGSEVGQCGNGARCVARFIHEKKLSTKTSLTLGTKTTRLKVLLQDEHYREITAELGIPSIDSESLMISSQTLHAVNLGNPHAVIEVQDLNMIAVDEIGKVLNKDAHFSDGVNVEFMQVINENNLTLRVYERGVGETQACGSGACAAMVCARKFYGAASTMNVALPGGVLHVAWQGDGYPVFLTGEAVHVFDGIIDF